MTGDHRAAQALEKRLLALFQAGLGAAPVPSVDHPLAIAISGGGDSVAALLLAARLFAPGALVAVSVDHGLRPEAAEELRFVARLCAGLGVAHHILTWDGPSGPGNLMDMARRARRSLIADWARGRGVGAVVLAHTQDDLAETFVMRLSRAAGLEGLSAMRPHWHEGGILWLRPLLDAARDDLRAYLRQRGQTWVDDPTNENPAYERARTRAALGQLADLGLNSAQIAQSAQHLARAESLIETLVTSSAAAVARCDHGDVLFDGPGFRALHPELRRRLMVLAIRWVSNAGYAPRAVQIEGLITDTPTEFDRTLGGCRITAGPHHLRICREHSALNHERGPTTALWDNRWRLIGPHDDALHIAALGPQAIALCPDWRASGLPRPSLAASPAVWRGETLISAPLAGLSNGWHAQLNCGDFPLSLLSH